MDQKSQLNPIRLHRQNNGGIAGIILISIGALALLGQLAKSHGLGLLLLPAWGLLFLMWGLLTRRAGLLIAGGILSGIGMGAYLILGPLAYLGWPATTGIFLLSMAAGFGFITPLSAFSACGIRWWPLIPASVLAITGGLLLAGYPVAEVDRWASILWPGILILFGLFTLIRWAVKR